MIILCSVVTEAQEIKPLTIGDTLPDITLYNVYNYPASTLQLSALKGKPILLDFWNRYCTSCIETFPALHELNDEFKNKFKIIMVDDYYGDSIQKISQFFDKWKERTGTPFKLTYKLQDTVLRLLFPYAQIPHDVWINSQGIVSAITFPDEVNAKNLATFIQNDDITLPLKNDYLLFNRDKPLLKDENAGNDPSFIYRSLITGYKKNLGAVIGQEKNEDGKISRLFVINAPLELLFAKAYPQVFKVSANRIVVEAPPPIVEAFKQHSSQKDTLKYCYEIITSPLKSAEIEKCMREDLFRAFHVRAKNEMRILSCYLVTANSNIKASLSKGGTPAMNMEVGMERPYFRNLPVFELINLIARITGKPVINETKLNANIDISFPRDINKYSPEKLKVFLKEKGFDLKIAKRPMKAIVISEN